MCRHFDPTVARQCREDDAEEVMKKDTANFCDWFIPAAGRYVANSESKNAAAQLDALFGGEDPAAPSQNPLSAAEDLFRK